MTGADNTPAGLIDQLHRTWTSVGEVGASLTASQWRAPTDCPGWDVRAQVAHLVGTESMLAGRPMPAFDGPYPPHVKNAIAQFNQAWIDALAELSDEELLAAFVSITVEREAALRALPDEAWEAEGDTPIGRAPYRRFMQIRVFDCWLHDQDIRAATGHPGHDSGPAAEQSVDEVARALGFLVGKRAQAPDGSHNRIALTGPLTRTIDVTVDGRARVVDPLSGEPTVTVRTDAVTLARLAGGRISGEAAVARGQVTFDGDRSLGERLVTNLAFTM